MTQSLSDALFLYALCRCGQQRLKTEVSCGRCPCRRATDDECDTAQRTGTELLRCHVCDSPMVPSIQPGYEPKGTYIQAPRCYECFKMRSKVTRCGFSKHRGDREFPLEQALKVAIISTNKTTLGRPSQVTACPTCVVKHKLQSWDEYALSRGTIDPVTGEVSPIIQHTPELTIKAHPINAFGGMRVCWCPKRGSEGTYVKRDGFTLSNTVVFNPLRFASFQHGSRRDRIIVCTRMDWPTSANTYQGTVWHPSVNAWLATCQDESGDCGMRQFGWCYARITGVTTSESHTFAVSSFEAFKRDNDHKATVAEWLHHCESLETNWWPKHNGANK